MAMELDQVGPLDRAEVGAGAALVDTEERVEGLQRRAVHVQGIREELADGERRPASSTARDSNSSACRQPFA
jgi:hypothetical protein